MGAYRVAKAMTRHEPILGGSLSPSMAQVGNRLSHPACAPHGQCKIPKVIHDVARRSREVGQVLMAVTLSLLDAAT